MTFVPSVCTCFHLSMLLSPGSSELFLVAAQLYPKSHNHSGSLPCEVYELLFCSFPIVFICLCVLCFTDSITPTVELNALCMKLGRKPSYKPVDPYTGVRSPYNYNMRGGSYPPR